MNVRWVKQEQKYGCVPASIAMVLGKTYWEVANDLAPNLGGFVKKEDGTSVWQEGISFEEYGMAFLYEGLEFLAQQGYAAQTRYRYFANKPREQWPLAPFAPVHIVVVMNANDSHAVVMTEEGVVLDPIEEGPTTLDRWNVLDEGGPNGHGHHHVTSMTGLWKVKDK